jgi:predicted DNA-binding protein
MTDATRPEQVAALLDDPTLTWEEVPADQAPPVAEQQAEAETMVVRTVRMPQDIDQRLSEEAAARGLNWSEMVREFVRTGLAALDDDQPISRADALRALAGVHPLPRRTA